MAAIAVALAAPAGAESLSLRDGAGLGLASSKPAEASLSFDAEGDAAVDAPISAGRAVLYSLLLPGLGDYKLGNTGRATAFFIAEGAIWISYATFQVQGSQREDEYESLAVQFAGVDQTGHSDDFYALVREYDNSDQYTADVKTDGRIELSDNGTRNLEDIGADALDAYFVENRVEDYEPWRWSSLERRLQYSEVRSSSKTSYRSDGDVIAAAAANRVVSAVFAYAGARSAAKAQTPVGYDLRLRPSPAGGVDVALSLSRAF